MTITLKRAGHCRECGKELKAGTRAKWYRNGAVYCAEGHGKGNAAAEPVGQFQEDWICSDAGYEYQMQRAYERANGRW